VLRARLGFPAADDRPWGWLGPLLIHRVRHVPAFNRLRVPRAVIFDETYYVKDAWSILQHGVEWVPSRRRLPGPRQPPDDRRAHEHLRGGAAGRGAEYVVQPEMGKLPHRLGRSDVRAELVRLAVASALFGSLAILLMCRIARRLTRSTLLGCLAGLLMALDGLEFALSRTAYSWTSS